MVRERYSHIEAGELGDVATEALSQVDGTQGLDNGGVQIRVESEAVRSLSALCPKPTAPTAV